MWRILYDYWLYLKMRSVFNFLVRKIGHEHNVGFCRVLLEVNSARDLKSLTTLLSVFESLYPTSYEDYKSHNNYFFYDNDALKYKKRQQILEKTIEKQRHMIIQYFREELLAFVKPKRKK